MEETNTRANETQAGSEITGLARQLCRVAGSDLKILSRCSHEISRHARIGAIIISTAVLATVSMFFAIQTVSQSTITGIVAGLIWGMAIFILDSYIISSYKKNDNKWIEFKVVIPRLILAIVLGCSISIPMELKFFSTEIGDELITMRTEKGTENQDKVNKQYDLLLKPFNDEREKLSDENIRLQGEMERASKQIDTLNDKMALEGNGKGLTTKIGHGAAYHDLEQRRDYIKTNKLPQLASVDTPKIKDNIKRITFIDQKIAQIAKPTPEAVKFTGLSSQMDALKRLTSKNTYVLFAYWIFFLLILGIETSPIFVKFFTTKGSYDEIFAMNEYITMLEQQKRKSDFHELINAEIDAVRSININKKEAQDLANKQLMNAIALAQGEIAEKAIAKWKEKQLMKVDENPGHFITTISNQEISEN